MCQISKEPLAERDTSHPTKKEKKKIQKIQAVSHRALLYKCHNVHGYKHVYQAKTVLTSLVSGHVSWSSTYADFTIWIIDVI